MEYLIHQAKHSEIRSLVSHMKRHNDYDSVSLLIFYQSLFLSCAPDWKCKAYLYWLPCKSRFFQAVLLAANSKYFSLYKSEPMRNYNLPMAVKCTFDLKLDFKVTWKEIALELILDFSQLHLNHVAPEGRDRGETCRKVSEIHCIPWESYIRTCSEDKLALCWDTSLSGTALHNDCLVYCFSWLHFWITASRTGYIISKIKMIHFPT